MPQIAAEIPKEDSPDAVRCPKCGSTQIYVDKKGYGAAKGCCGAAICGPLGALCGLFGSNKIKKTCLKCNHSWV